MYFGICLNKWKLFPCRACMGPLIVNTLVMFSSAEVLWWLEPDVMGSWFVFAALCSVSAFIAFITSKCLLNLFF